MILWDNTAGPDTLPLMARPAEPGIGPSALTAWAGDNAAEWRPRLLGHGALLFRGFGFDSPASFEAFAQRFSPDLLSYTGGASPRRRIHGRVYNSTEASPRLVISQHHEGAYLPEMPAMICFYCSQPATSGGHTPLTSARKVTARIPAEVLDTFERRRVMYVNHLHAGLGPGRSWQAQFETQDRATVERTLRDGGYTFEWRPGGGLVTRLVCDAVKRHPATGERLWIAQADHWHPSGLDPAVRAQLARRMPEPEFPFNSYYGDGSALDEAELDRIREAIRLEIVSFPWEKGDVLVCDNLLVSHGRQAYEGERTVYATLG
jgi:alpha-ketoglutarate-dependent taurine dioxygenase